MQVILGYFIGILAAIIFGSMFVFYDSIFLFSSMPESVLLAGVVLGVIIAVASVAKLCTGITGRFKRICAIVIGIFIPAFFICALAITVFRSVDFFFQDINFIKSTFFMQ